MIDNLQVHYLQQLDLALKSALHGRLSVCVDMLLELRLKPDLSMYTRAVVSLSLADLTTIGQHPDKMKYAREGLRLAKELQEDSTADGSAFWRQTYIDLVNEGEEKVRKVGVEEANFLESLKAKDKEGADLGATIGGLSLTASEQHEVLNRSKAIPVDKGKRQIENKMVDVEGTFSLKLSSSSAMSRVSDTGVSGASDEVGGLPIITKAGKPESSLPTSPTSSRPGPVQPE